MGCVGGCWVIGDKATRCFGAQAVDKFRASAAPCGWLVAGRPTGRRSKDVSISEPLARLAVHSIDDLVGLVPYLIGFHPEESLVVIVIDSGRVEVTARVDLEAVSGRNSPDGLVARLFHRYPRAAGWFIAYTDDDDLAWEVLGGCAALGGDLRVQRLLQVGQDEWRSDTPDGPIGMVDARVSAVAAEAAVLGLPVRSSRRELAAGISGPPESEGEVLSVRFEAATVTVDRLGARGRRRMLRRLLASERLPDREDSIRLALLVAHVEGQVRVLRRLSRDTAEQQLALWTRVVRHTVVPYRPAVLGLLGMAAWQNGDGALAMVCLEQLDRIDPLEPIAAVLDWLNELVVPPDEWEERREVLLAALEDQFTVAGRQGSRPHR